MHSKLDTSSRNRYDRNKMCGGNGGRYIRLSLRDIRLQSAHHPTVTREILSNENNAHSTARAD